MKHDDLWNDALADAPPPDVRSESIARMRSEAARIRLHRRAVRSLAIVAVLALAGWLALPKQESRVASRHAAPVVTRKLQGTPSTAAKPAVHYLNDDELINRLRDLGVGIGVAGSEEGRQVLLVSREGEVFRP